MSVILGIDAAWTISHPSGVALIQGDNDAWACLGLAPSYESFIQLADGAAINWQSRARGSPPDVAKLLRAAELLAGVRVDLVTIDMPISLAEISGRRLADNAISTRFAARHCSVHSPNADRPGALGKRLTSDFAACGYPVATILHRAPKADCLVEVFPHLALLSLLAVHMRVKYKVSRSRRYWPDASVPERIRKLLSVWNDIRRALQKEFSGIELPLPTPSETGTLAQLKCYEDALDALLCAWVGVQFLRDRISAVGDSDAAIWYPRDLDREVPA